ncbi:HlyD family efflux transporter periplasmic adaptor subunit [Pseudomonas sp. LJDD11]|uniref:HlyD family efflux transporter periplasmic adaptor subunit n=1 Tax=Pseudomonas sp. LJDD11 TaxID=2931984 RepID=UPI00211B79F9|nr:HlyD family efflux transporter periplasmic adaptor subunit [Pseudomonas sp. LJDD11]MCQ9427210.1 HlyD family efflux transporter periplasmic adaptor subunit [Pseudomonas sp. LJDD11]
MSVSVRPLLAPAGLPTPAASALPTLQRHLRVHPGPRLDDGSPSWTLEDPARSSFFRITWPEQQMLSHWQLGNAQAIADKISASTTLDMQAEEVEGFAQFLRESQLVELSGDAAIRSLRQRHQKKDKGWAGWLLQNYLSIHIPLLRPDAFLDRTLPRVRPLLGRGFAMATLCAGVLGLYLVTRQWDTFIHSFLYFFSLEGALLAAATLALTKILHEFGHAYACKLQGCRVPTMGVAFLVLWPVLYTDASGAWRLPRRRQRLAIGGAGMLAELSLAAWATLLWSFLDEGPLRSAAFMLASTTWLLTLAVNLNPLMRFDGYFLLCDLLDVPNLQQRSFELARWRLREALFGFKDPAPEYFKPRLRRTLLVFAFATWIYRFFLFLGIALLVYHYAFKLLGILLFVVEIVHFIARPIVNELRHWYQRRKEYRMNRHTLISGGVLLAALILVIVPWRSRVEAPALLRAEHQANLYVPVGAQVSVLHPEPGQPIAADTLLWRLSAPELEQQRQTLERDIELLRNQSSYQQRSSEDAARQNVARQELALALRRQQALSEQVRQLEVRAPFAGVLVEVAGQLASGQWLAQGEWLGTLVDPHSVRVEAFVGERDRERLSTCARAWFYPEDPGLPRQPLVVEALAQTAVKKLSSAPELASLYQGSIAAQLDAQQVPVPEQALYRVMLRPAQATADLHMALRGKVLIEAQARSPLLETAREVLTVLIRESSF